MRALWIIVAVAVVLVVYGVADWKVIGNGPVYSYALGKCTDAEEGTTLFDTEEGGRFGTLNGKSHAASRSEARAICRDSYRNGRLTLRGGTTG